MGAPFRDDFPAGFPFALSTIPAVIAAGIVIFGVRPPLAMKKSHDKLS
jgi:hypothetical protein